MSCASVKRFVMVNSWNAKRRCGEIVIFPRMRIKHRLKHLTGLWPGYPAGYASVIVLKNAQESCVSDHRPSNRRPMVRWHDFQAPENWWNWAQNKLSFPFETSKQIKVASQAGNYSTGSIICVEILHFEAFRSSFWSCQVFTILLEQCRMYMRCQASHCSRSVIVNHNLPRMSIKKIRQQIYMDSSHLRESQINPNFPLRLNPICKYWSCMSTFIQKL